MLKRCCTPATSACERADVTATSRTVTVTSRGHPPRRRAELAFARRVAGAVAEAHKEAEMGGTGSGRWPIKMAVDECRLLEIDELCNGGRWASHPRGRIRWLQKGATNRPAGR